MTTHRALGGFRPIETVRQGDRVVMRSGMFSGNQGIVTAAVRGRFRVLWDTGVESSAYRGDIRPVSKKG